MLRFLSILLVIAGLLAAGLGAAALLERSEVELPRAGDAPSASAPSPDQDGPVDLRPEEPAVDAASAPMVAPSEEAAPPVGAASAPATDQASAAGEAAPSDGTVFESASAPGAFEGPDAEPALPDEDTSFMFQTQSEIAPPAPIPDALPSTTDRALAAATPSLEDALKTVPVAHETPRSAEYKRAFDVTFAIDATGDDTAVDALPGRGIQEAGEARVSEQVEVRLSGANFSIVANSPDVQTLSPLTENVWRWSVMPTAAGTHDLVFEIYAVGDGSMTPLRTYRDTVTVKVSGLNRAIAFADQANPLFVLLGGLGSAIAGFLGALKFFRKG
jgi:hypothetical protein